MSLLLTVLALRGGVPSAPEILRRVQKAYDSVRTFEQDVTGDISGMKGTAHISFSRPGRLRVSGNTMFGTAKYDLVADGKSTWVFSNGNWSSVQSPEMGIATITGISANAGTLSPAMLLHTAWGRLTPESAQGASVKMDAGRWLISMKKPLDERVWVDPAARFVTRTETQVMGRTIAVVFGAPRVNGAIPASRFRR